MKTKRKTNLKKRINLMKEMEGQEVWTNAFGKRFGERVCVGVNEGMLWKEGKKFKPTKKEVKELWEDMLTQELGSPSQRKRDLEFEFGGQAQKIVDKINKRK